MTSVAKLVAAGADYRKAYLSLQEFFEKLRDEPTRWGKPFAALLGALDAQLELGAAAIGGKDSMSGSFQDLDVPPTLISFAIAPVKAGDVLSPEFKEAGHGVYLFGSRLSLDACRRPGRISTSCAAWPGVKAAWAVEHGVAEAVMKMSFGNGSALPRGPRKVRPYWYVPMPGAIVAEVAGRSGQRPVTRLGDTMAEPVVTIGGDSAPIDELLHPERGGAGARCTPPGPAPPAA